MSSRSEKKKEITIHRIKLIFRRISMWRFLSQEDYYLEIVDVNQNVNLHKFVWLRVKILNTVNWIIKLNFTSSQSDFDKWSLIIRWDSFSQWFLFSKF